VSFRRTAAVSLALLLISTIGCGQGASSESAPAPVSRGLSAGVIARVGERAIHAEAVGRIAAAQQLTPAAARDLAIHDALFAEGAQERGLDRSLDVVLATRAMLARRLLRQIRAEAEQAPITDEDLARAAERRWLDVDRPEGFRTIHAVVRFDESAPGDKRARALDLAEAIRAAALPLQDRASELLLPASASPSRPKRVEDDPLVAAFQKAMDPFIKGDHDGLPVTVEPLPAVAADGQVLTPEGASFDPTFSRAAAALGQRGAVSPVVVSSFGAHVILLLEKIPAVKLSLEERRALLYGDIVVGRARAAEEKLLAGLRGRSAWATDADALLALVAVDP
jgi:hypothetical protein